MQRGQRRVSRENAGLGVDETKMGAFARFRRGKRVIQSILPLCSPPPSLLPCRPSRDRSDANLASGHHIGGNRLGRNRGQMGPVTGVVGQLPRPLDQVDVGATETRGAPDWKAEEVPAGVPDRGGTQQGRVPARYARSPGASWWLRRAELSDVTSWRRRACCRPLAGILPVLVRVLLPAPPSRVPRPPFRFAVTLRSCPIVICELQAAVMGRPGG